MQSSNPLSVPCWRLAWALVSMIWTCGGVPAALAQQTSAFTYHGQLRAGGTNANGTNTLVFTLYDAASGGLPVATPITNSTILANGLFTVNLNFGGAAFNGGGRWLSIAVEGETLAPRMQVMPAPYALFAAVAATVTNHAIMNSQMATNAVAGSNIQENAVATINIQNDAITDPKIVSVRGSKVTGAVALATNAGYAAQLTTSVITLLNSNTLLAANTWEAGVLLPGLADHDFAIADNGVPQLVIRTNGGIFGNGVGLTNVSAVPRVEAFTTTGSFIVPSNITRITVEAYGGGGGGGRGFAYFNGSNFSYANPGSGGGAGAYAMAVINVSPGVSYPVVVGAAGDSTSAGGASAFADVLTAAGGQPGADASSQYQVPSGPGGAGGNASGPFIKAKGGSGARGQIDYLNYTTGVAGNGGMVFRGGPGGWGCPLSEGSGRDGITPSGGGGGGCLDEAAVVGSRYLPGGKGGAGVVLISY